MFNFLALLGWNPGDEREVMTKRELVEAFALERVQKKSAVFDLDKLHWLNGQHLARRSASDLAVLVLPRLAELGVPAREIEGRSVWFESLVDLLKLRARTVRELARQALPYLRDDLVFDEEAVARHWSRDPAATLEQLGRLRDRLADTPWAEEALEQELRGLSSEMGVGAGKLIHPLRVALTGRAASPGIFEVLVLVGRERSLARIEDAMQRVRDLS